MSKEVNEERAPRTVEDVKEMLSKHSNGEIQRTIQNCITILQNDHVLADQPQSCLSCAGRWHLHQPCKLAQNESWHFLPLHPVTRKRRSAYEYESA